MSCAVEGCVWSAWTTEAREINHETDPVMHLVRYCYVCKKVETA